MLFSLLKAFNVIFVIFWLSACSHKTLNSEKSLLEQKDNKAIKVVLLAGQSNMSGAGDFDKLSAHDKQRVIAAAKHVKLSEMGARAKPLSYRVAEKYHVDKYKLSKTFGPELFIGVMLAEKFPDDEFLLIKNSQGGTSLYGAWSASWTLEKALLTENKKHKQSHSLHQQHLTSIENNLAQLSKAGKSYKVVGMAWMQGENDAAKEVSAMTYQVNLIELIASYRKAVNQPSLPFVIGQINSNYGNYAAGPQMVRSSQKQVAEGDAYSALVPTINDMTWQDYPKYFDNVHYNAQGQKRLGIAFYQQLLKLGI